MDDAKIKEVVTATVKELKRAGLLQDYKTIAYAEISERLYRYYGGEDDKEISAALDDLRSDYYFRILPLYYGKSMTIEGIAERMSVETSTIVRNKKRLCLAIYSLID